MNALAEILGNAARADIYHLTSNAIEMEQAAATAGLIVWCVDIGHVHGKNEFLQKLAIALKFPERFRGDWNALPGGFLDLSWQPAAGWVLMLEKSKHFAAGHKHEFDEAMTVLAAAVSHWRAQGKPFWVLVGGAEGWSSGFPPLPSQ